MRQGRRLLLVASLLVLCAVLAIALVPDARGWVTLHVRSLRLRAALTLDFGSRLGSIESGEWHLEGRPASGVTLELTGGLGQPDLCRAMLALDKVVPSAPSLLSVVMIRPDASMAFETLTWDRASGRLEHWVGDGAYSESLSTSVSRGEIPSGVDSAMLQDFADGESIKWR